MKKIIILAFGLFLLSANVFAQTPEDRLKCLFIYNFSKYVKWPAESSAGEFAIGVYGKSDITKALTDMSSTKKVNGSAIVIKEFQSAKKVQDCHILYIPQSESDKLEVILEELAGQPILIISDQPGFAEKGSVVNFVTQDGKIKFEINKQQAESRNLKVSSTLLNLAIVV